MKVTVQTTDAHAPALKQISEAEVVAQVEEDYEVEEPDKLIIRMGDIITDITVVQNGWWKGKLNGKRGMFPCNLVKVVILNPSKPAARTRVEAQVMYDFDAVEPDELTIKIGDTITDISVVDDIWWRGVVNGKEGIFPSSCVKICTGTSENSAQKKKVLAKVCFSHTPDSDSELFLVEDDIIEITSRPDPWWWEGIVKGKKGYFPSHCVDLLQKDDRGKTKLLKRTRPVEARAKYDYDAVKPEELTIKVGDTITDITVVHDGWWEGVVKGKRGMFPSNCVEESKGTSESFAQNKIVLAKVVLNHTPQSEDELFLVKDDIIEITSQLEPLWWKGIVNGYQGHFPSYCVTPIQDDEEGSSQQDDATPVKAQVVYNYDAAEPDELTIKVGDIITDIHIGVGGWWEGVVKEKRGRFPSSFVEIHTGPPEQSSQNKNILAKVTPSYTLQSDREVSLVEGDIIEITNQQDPFWWKGVVNSRQGHFPSHCVVPIPEDGEDRKQQDYATPGELLEQPLTETETTITKNGATVTIPGTKVVLNIPSDALPERMEQCLIKIRIIPRTVFQDPEITFSSNSSVVVEILPNKLLLRHPAQLMIPHCLLLKENKTPLAKVFMSHHEKGCSPSWEEHSSLEYRIERTCCVVWLKSFCWVAIKIEDKEVLAKELILYTCGKNLLPTDDHAEIAVGYYPDLAGEAKFLSLNKNPGVVKKTPFTFMKEGRHPLCWSLEKFPSNHWNLYFPEENNMEIAFKDISASVERQCTFVLEKTVANPRKPMCIFKASQDEGLQPVRLAICPEQSQHFSFHPLVDHSPSGSHPQATMTSQDDGMNSTSRGDDNIQPRKLEVRSRTPEEQLRRCFMFLKKNLAGDWKDLGRCLKSVTEDELTRLGKEHKDDIEESIYQMLLSWQRKNGTLASPEMLIDALNEIFRKDLADKLLAAL